MGYEWCIRRILVLFFTLAALSLLSGCAPTGQNTTHSGSIPPDKNILRVGVSTTSPPLIFRQGNQIVGLEADLARELAKYLGKSLHFVELKWEDQIPALLENRIDIIMSGMTSTPLRKVRVDFTVSYFESGQMALIRRTDLARFSTGLFTFTTSSAIGAIKDTTGEYFVEAQFSSVQKKLYKNTGAAVKDLVKKEIDMFIHDAPMIIYLASENESRGLTVLFALLTKEPLAWAVRKDNAELLESANKFLQTISEEGKLKKIINRRIPFTK
jgi:polar amino acid transport system substrate-binding protein